MLVAGLEDEVSLEGLVEVAGFHAGVYFNVRGLEREAQLGGATHYAALL